MKHYLALSLAAMTMMASNAGAEQAVAGQADMKMQSIPYVGAGTATPIEQAEATDPEAAPSDAATGLPAEAGAGQGAVGETKVGAPPVENFFKMFKKNKGEGQVEQKTEVEVQREQGAGASVESEANVSQ